MMKPFLIAMSALTLTATASFAEETKGAAEVVGDYNGNSIYQVEIHGHVETPKNTNQFANQSGSAMEDAAFTETCGNTNVKVVSRQLIEERDAQLDAGNGMMVPLKVFDYHLTFFCNK